MASIVKSFIKYIYGYLMDQLNNNAFHPNNHTNKPYQAITPTPTASAKANTKAPARPLPTMTLLAEELEATLAGGFEAEADAVTETEGATVMVADAAEETDTGADP